MFAEQTDVQLAGACGDRASTGEDGMRGEAGTPRASILDFILRVMGNHMGGHDSVKRSIPSDSAGLCKHVNFCSERNGEPCRF